MSKIKKILLVVSLITTLGFLPLFGQKVSADTAINIQISRDSYADSIGSTVQPGGGPSDFNAIKLANSGSLPVTVNWIKITRSGGSDDDFNNVSLYALANGVRTQLSSSQNLFQGIAFFDNVSLNIPAQASAVVIVSAGIYSGAKSGDVVSLTLANPTDLDIAVQGNSTTPTISGSASGVTRTILGFGPDTTSPADPSNIKIQSVGLTPGLQITWDDPSDSDLSKIVIHRSTVSGLTGSLIYSTNRGTGIMPIKTYLDNNVVAGTTYYYTVKAVDIAGNESSGTVQYSGFVYPRGLNITLDTSSPSAQQIATSSIGVLLAAFKLTTSNCDAEITNLTFDGLADASGNKNLNLMSDFSLYVDGVFVASSTSPSLSFYNDNMSKLTLGTNVSSIVSLRGDVSPNAYSGSFVLKIVSLSARQISWLPLSVYGLGTSARQVTILGTSQSNQTPAPTPSPNPGVNSLVNTSNIPEGALIRAKGDIDVYIVKYVGAKKFKRLILSPSVFNNYGHLKWSDIRDVDQAVVDAFTTSELVRAVGDEKVYKLYPSGDTGQKRWITAPDVFSRMGFDPDSIYEINSFDRDSYITGSNLE